MSTSVVADGRRGARFSELHLKERDAATRFRARAELEAEAAAEGLSPHEIVDEYEDLVARITVDRKRAALLALALAVRGDDEELATTFVRELRHRHYVESLEAEA